MAKMVQRDDRLLLVLASFVLLVIVCGGVIVGMAHVKPVISTPTTASDSTANWKKYTNSAGKYSFKFDPSWVITNNGQGINLDLSSNKLSISAEPTKLPLKEYVDQKTWCVSITSATGKDFTVDAIPALRFDKTPCGLVGSTDVYSVHNGMAYHLQIDTQANYASIEPDFDQILSTFKFTDAKSPIDRNQAVQLVKDQPEVKQWLGLFNSQSKSTSHIEVENEDDSKYMIHAYEGFSDHLATFNWYYVNKMTGAVSKEF